MTGEALLALTMNVWAVFGCSNTELSWGGLVADVPTIVHQQGGTKGCDLDRMARHARRDRGKCVDQFRKRVSKEGYPDAIWVQLCIDEAPSPVPDDKHLSAYADVLEWLEANYEGVPLYVSPLPDFESGCRGGPTEWYAYEVGLALRTLSEADGRTQNGVVLQPMLLEHTRYADPDCLKEYGRCDQCHPNNDRIGMDGEALREWLAVPPPWG